MKSPISIINSRDNTRYRDLLYPPYMPQDKRSVENRIGMIRQLFTKGTALRDVSEQRIKTVERHLNDRPIRKFG